MVHQALKIGYCETRHDRTIGQSKYITSSKTIRGFRLFATWQSARHRLHVDLSDAGVKVDIRPRRGRRSSRTCRHAEIVVLVLNDRGV